MGFNPGGNPATIKKSIIETLEEIKEDYCSYKDECWHKSCREDCRDANHCGKSRHQTRVTELAKILDCNIRDVFAANAIFIRSNNQDSLAEKLSLFENCWPIHQIFLSIVQPRIILCLGNGEGSSAFSLLRQKLAPNEKHEGPVKEFIAKIPLPDKSPITSRVIGVRHPSYPWFDPTKDLSSYLHKNPMLFQEGIGRHKGVVKEG